MAKKFNFKLEPVLKFRADKVARAKDALNQVVKIRLEKENQINETIEIKNNLMSQSSTSIKASDLQAKNNYYNFLGEEIKRLENEKNQIVEIENLRRLKLTNAMKDEKVIEKLKEKQLNYYIDDQKKEESKFLDELGIMGIEKNKEKNI